MLPSRPLNHRLKHNTQYKDLTPSVTVSLKRVKERSVETETVRQKVEDTVIFCGDRTDRNRQRDRQRDRQTDRQRGRERDREIDRERV